MHKSSAALVAATLGLATLAAPAQEPGSRQTREFAQAAESADQFEILEAQTALVASANPDVRKFAAQMLEDHRRTAQEIRDAAAKSGIKPPERAMSAEQAQMLGALQGVNGSAFDKLYLKQQTLAHRSALVVQQIYARSGDDPGLRQLANATVPLIAAHGEMANRMAEALGGE